MITTFLKKLLYRESLKHPRLQRGWGMLHTLAIYGMNYGGGGLIEQSGEEWVLREVIAPACRGADTPVVFDVGANVGDYARLVRRHLPRAAVYCFEPSRPTFEQLERDLRGDALTRPFNLGLSDEEKSVELYSYTVEGEEQSLISSIDRRLPTQVVKVEVSASEEVRVQTLDAFCEAEGVGRIDFLKLDVEGHEMAVLRGARRMLERGAISAVQFEFGPANIYSRTYFYDFWTLLSGDFRIFRIVPRGLAPVAYYGEHREVFLTTNYLALRRGAGVRP